MSARRRSATDAEDASWSALLTAQHRLSAAAVLLSILSPAFSAFVTATVLPSVVAEIGGLALYAWASTAYAVASILGSAGCVIVVRRAGTPATLIIAAGVLLGGTSACALAPTMPLFVVARGLQGLGAGMMIAAVHGVIREVFPAVLWPRLLATVSAAWGIAAMSGPAVGGFLAARGAWRAAFWIMAPLIVVAAATTWHILPRVSRPAADPAREPLGRLALLCAGVLCVASVANVASAGARGALLVGAAAAIALMLRSDGTAAVRLFPANMLSLRGRGGKGFWMIFCVAICTTPGGVYLPLLLQVLHGIPPAAAGYLYAAQSLAWTAASLVGARLSGGSASRAVTLGPIMIGTGFAGLLLTLAEGPMMAITLSVILIGTGIGACWAHVGSIVLGSAREGEGATTASLIPTTQTFAVSLGAALCGIIANAAGLSTAATRSAAATAGGWLFGVFLLAPVAALIIATRLQATGGDAGHGRGVS